MSVAWESGWKALGSGVPTTPQGIGPSEGGMETSGSRLFPENSTFHPSNYATHRYLQSLRDGGFEVCLIRGGGRRRVGELDRDLD